MSEAYEEAADAMENALKALENECPLCGEDCSQERLLCDNCFKEEHGPGDDKDLDPERNGGYTFDVRAIEDTQC